MLWSEPEPNLPNNYGSALGQLHSLKRRFQRDPDLKSLYQQSIDADVEKRFVKILNESEIKGTFGKEWYFPHHPVLNPNKPGKVRRVCNAASKYKEVPEQDRSALRFLWRPKFNESVQIYEKQRQDFGAKSSTTCANYALKGVGIDNEDEFPIAAKAIHNNFYMDDLIKLVETAEEGIEVSNQLQPLLSKHAFELKKWISNNNEVNTVIPEGLKSISKTKQVDVEPNAQGSSVLGLQWNVTDDSLQVCRGTNKEVEAPINQRKILSPVSSVFDPIGLFALFSVRMRRLLKNIWTKNGQHWDNKVEPGEEAEFLKWKEQLPISRANVTSFNTTLGIASSGNGSEIERTNCQRTRDEDTQLQFLVGLNYSTAMDTQLSPQTASWKHVSGINNPADIGTRAIKVDELKRSEWLTGPAWLKQPESEWPEQFNLIFTADKENIPMSTFITQAAEMKPIVQWGQFSNFNILVNTMAYVKRALREKKPATKMIDIEENEDAKATIFRLLQQEQFAEETKSLKAEKEIP
ncbi:uncharacterized protein LOC142338177 [Convolutriloba macropyga]|uniref:uncharacterized protein LOC142338177 n=1 Tax=Convolutriloba macropyga TaxID=536237 RepID=UPI003F51C643